MPDVAPVLFKKRTGKGAAARKRPATPPPDSDSGSEYSSEEENGVRVKRRKTTGLRTTNSSARAPQDLSKTTAFSGDRTAAIAVTDDATKLSSWYEVDPQKANANADDVPNLGISDAYKGASTYQSFSQKNPNAQKHVGPVKGPSNVRTITVIDFAPDVCKDYKQTGFCGFGDSCKFLHAREDYKQGWQLDKEWESVTKGKKPSGTIMSGGGKDGAKDAEEDEEESMLDNIPFACIICRGPYKNPVVTKCKHYFCEACALKRHKSKGGKTCAACGTDTGGSFSMAKNLQKLLDKKREREAKLEQQAVEDAEHGNAEDDD